VEYLRIKFIIEIHNYIKSNDEKIIQHFSNIHYDVHYHLAKSQIKIQPMYGETKMTNWMMG
jgi:hypothetical protein